MDKDFSFTVRDLPKPERPRERLQKLGPDALSSQELLALIIGRGIPKKSVMTIAQELLARFGNVKAIGQATLEERFAQIDIETVRKQLHAAQESVEKVPSKIRQLIALPAFPEQISRLFQNAA